MAFARRMFADNGWPVIDVTRRSIEETAAAIIRLYNERESGATAGGRRDCDRARFAECVAQGDARSRRGRVRGAARAISTNARSKQNSATPRRTRSRWRLAEAKALAVSREVAGLVLGSDSLVAVDGRRFDKPATREEARGAPAVFLRENNAAW